VFDNLVARSLAQLQRGCIVWRDGDSCRTFGDPDSELRASVVVHAPRCYRRLALGGSLGAAESLMDGDWSCDDLTALVRIFIRNMDLTSRLDRGAALVAQWLGRAVRAWRANTRRMARRNIHAHYDLGNDFFRLFLDDTLCYSSGIFEHPHATLREASLAKMRRACDQLQLQPSDHLLEIGTGWGGLAMHAAQEFGCRVTTTTISDEQYRLAADRFAQADLQRKIRLLNQDYRDLEGQFDKLVSIEMIEAVGHRYYGEFFRQCARLLKPDGAMLLQGIVIRDQDFATHTRSADFIGTYIFPGGCLPSNTALLNAATAHSDLRLVQLNDFAPHYALTLRAWRRNFWQNIDQVRRLGFDERFIRMWDYYFAYCEACFLERRVNVVQMLFAKPECRLPELHPQEHAEPQESVEREAVGV
jgi:cyclopropane-fatty-acyl-phospholipid synthase